MNKPLFSVICMCKNASISIRRCIESVLSQDYMNLEFLIQDGASTDGTLEIVNSYNDPRIKFVSEPDAGGGYAFINALKRSQGEFWCCCLADEELMPGAISWAVANLTTHPDAAAIYGDYYTTDIMGNILSANRAEPWDFRRYLCCELVPPFCSSFFRMSYLKNIDYTQYNECGEFDLWLRLGIRYSVYYCEGLASKFAEHEAGGTSQVSDYYRTLPGRILAIETLMKRSDTPHDVLALKDEAIAGIHLWMGSTFLGINAFDDFEMIVQKSFDYSPNMSRVCSLLHRYVNAMASIDASDRASAYIERITLMARAKKEVLAEAPSTSCSVSLKRDQVDNKRTELSKIFVTWLSCVAAAENRLYYRDQTVDSLMYLVDMVHSIEPDRIVELGTLSGLSLRTWQAAAPDTPITAIDLSFQPLLRSRQVLPLDLTQVTLLEQDILTIDFASLWKPDERVILYIDAHDDSGVPIMEHLLTSALPALPAGSMVIVDDIWYSPEMLDRRSAEQFFKEVVINEIDPLQCFDGYYASYWKRGSFFGFMEVIPLLEWVNSNNIELDFRSGVKSVGFLTGSV